MNQSQLQCSPAAAVTTAPVGRVFLTLLPVTLAVFVGFLTIGMQMPVLPLHLHETLGMGALVVGLVVGLQFALTFQSEQISRLLRQ